MGYKLFDINDREVFHKDLQEKAPWCADGERFENVFIKKIWRDIFNNYKSRKN
ncbi:hypothetical protein [Pedobacter sp. L105]|uniref:hypothetical protein n=1 Tax=Pedobacter sp. L105 TaxID=1641871 RepID=UPI00131EB00B|nr:hypothetical protein [Pedobacter sp. L105]